MNAVTKIEAADPLCDLCASPMAEDRAVHHATGLNICPLCLEKLLDATALDARSEVGLVGGRHPW